MPPKATYFRSSSADHAAATKPNTSFIPLQDTSFNCTSKQLNIQTTPPIINKTTTSLNPKFHNKVQFQPLVQEEDDSEDELHTLTHRTRLQYTNGGKKYAAIHSIPSGKLPTRGADLPNLLTDQLKSSSLYARAVAKLPWWAPPKAIFLVALGSLVMGVTLSVTLRKIHNKLLVAHCIPILPANMTALPRRITSSLTVPPDPWLDATHRHDLMDAHVAKENTYFDGMSADLAPLRADLVHEIDKRTPTSALIPKLHWFHTDGYFYAFRHDLAAFVKSQSRAALASDAAQIIVYVRPFLRLRPNDDLPAFGFNELSPDGNYLALAIDRSGNERFDVYIWDVLHQRRIGAGFAVTDAYYTARWVSNSVLVVSVVDSLGVPRGVDKIELDLANPALPLTTRTQLYWETAPDRSINVDLTSDGLILILQSVGRVVQIPILISVESVIHGDWSSNHPAKPAFAFIGVDGISEIQHHLGYLYIRTNLGLADAPHSANMFEVLQIAYDPRFPVNITAIELMAAERIWPHTPSVYVESIQVFQKYLVMWVRTNGGRQELMWRAIGPGALDLEWKQLLDWKFTSSYSVVPGIFTNPIGDIKARVYQQFDSVHLYFTNSSSVQFPSVWELNLSSGHVSNILTTQSNEPHTAKNYAQFRVWVRGGTVSGSPPPSMYFTAPSSGEYVPVDLTWKYQDGEQVPQARNPDGTPQWVRVPGTPARPTVVIAYGAYGTVTGSNYDPGLLALMDRGMVIAVVHPRGDGDLGPAWYYAGARMLKQNTFMDVERAIAALQSAGIAQPGKIALQGRSAGALVVGTAARSAFQTCGLTRPRFWTGVSVLVAQVPFVDMVTSASDVNTPWTTVENVEWGDPRNATELDHLLSISPYQTLEGLEACYATVGNRTDESPMPWPVVLVTTAKNDAQVMYTEPVRWVARLRYTQALAVGAVPPRFVRSDRLKKRDVSKPKCRETTDIAMDRPVLLRVYSGGHASGTGASGEAEWMAVVLNMFL